MADGQKFKVRAKLGGQTKKICKKNLKKIEKMSKCREKLLNCNKDEKIIFWPFLTPILTSEGPNWPKIYVFLNQKQIMPKYREKYVDYWKNKEKIFFTFFDPYFDPRRAEMTQNVCFFKPKTNHAKMSRIIRRLLEK